MHHTLLAAHRYENACVVPCLQAAQRRCGPRAEHQLLHLCCPPGGRRPARGPDGVQRVGRPLHARGVAARHRTPPAALSWHPAAK